ncbi:hypothetical protein SLS62_000501 [Diatrype stigma]|uniref:CENP-V/GFA domain-containing protein n=1 Tax=Diatrype stigma TaxID=117547 RepID=A0AAN9V1I0_9PEZI
MAAAASTSPAPSTDPTATTTLITEKKEEEGEETRRLTVRCQCGAVEFPTPAAQPTRLFHCHCTECQKQSGSAFGTSAIYPAADLFPLARDLEAKLGLYTRPTDRGGVMDCYFCAACGSRLFHRLRDGADGGAPRATVSIKGGCIEGLDWGRQRDGGGAHIYVRSAVMRIPPDWEQYDTVPPSMQ